ncbi:MAG: ABC transporter permease [Candidatus Acidiferrales bacterium]
MNLLHDLRLAFRTLSRNRALTAAVIGILALGIGGTTTMFSVVYGVLLKPLPLHQPEQLVMFIGSVTARPGERDPMVFWQQHPSLQSVTQIAGVGGVNLGTPGATQYASAAEVSASFFTTLQEAPQLGRGFLPHEERSGNNNVVVLSDALWLRSFAGDREIVGRFIRVNGEAYTVVGVARPGFAFPGGTQLWIPGNVDGGSRRVGQPEDTKAVGEMYGGCIGRLREGVTLEQAQADTRAMSDEMHRLQQPAGVASGSPTTLAALHERVTRWFEPALFALLGAAAFVLLIAVANAANLLLARAAARHKEVAVRRCLGAGWWQVARPRMMECLLLAAGGCLFGVLLTYWCVRLIHQIGPSNLLRLREVEIDPAVLAFAIVISFVVGAVMGLAPSMQATTPNLILALKQEGPGATGGLARRVRQALVAGEMALACVLLIGAIILIQSFFNLIAIDSGFDTERVMTFSLSLPAATYDRQSVAPGKAGDAEASGDWRDMAARQKPLAAEDEPKVFFQRRLLEALRALPGVATVGTIAKLPVADSFGMIWVGPSNDQGTLATVHQVSGNYLQAMGIPVVAGRYFEESDFTRQDRVVISQSLADKFWPGKNPVGQQLEMSWHIKQFREVIGVVPDTAVDALDDFQPVRVQFYVPDLALRDFTVVMRARMAPQNLDRAVRGIVQSLDKDVSPFRMRSLDEVISDSTKTQKFQGQLLGAFAGTAVVLAIFGVAAVMAYSVAARTHEMGVRMTLGATRGEIVRMVLREGTNLSLAGVLIGLTGAWWLSRYIAALLYGVSATDPWTYAGAAAALLAGALLGSVVPALRASRVDPAVALRYE